MTVSAFELTLVLLDNRLKIPIFNKLTSILSKKPNFHSLALQVPIVRLGG